MSHVEFPLAPELAVSAWLNTPTPLSLEDFRGKPLLIYVFQMLCPACISHGLPQLARVANTFGDDIAIMGLHSVFEHHGVMGPEALQAFVHEYRLRFPIAIDRPAGRIPETMARWGFQGTPTLVLLDADGRVRMQHLGVLEDMKLGKAIGTLLLQDALLAGEVNRPETSDSGLSAGSGPDLCDDRHCQQ
ncbi:TlpA disulfide reductase family protein [Shewanella amazonensis]|uniref:Thioredoxin domain-containing protein n=1 Tax=Shewanella amazonensis (strain ATCC BAA-1098 / SB2B) TaxID=326297 RepID=A1S934_SHEAM|nr:TlpA disulfide reductase family protein [Shewanella amazonensis]ABM00891.1 conserved hypothetical protein [Shewanella amazonensis SB2B]